MSSEISATAPYAPNESAPHVFHNRHIGLHRTTDGRLWITMEAKDGSWILQCSATPGLFGGWPPVRVLEASFVAAFTRPQMQAAGG